MTNKPNLDLRAMRTFLVVARTRSMSAAARELDMSQSAVSQTITNIERSLDAALFIRDQRPLALTQLGKIFREEVEPIVRRVELIPVTIREANSSQLPAIRLGLVDSFAGTAGPVFIKSMINAATQMAIWTGLAPSHGEALLARKVDVIITSDLLDDTDGLERRVVWREPCLLALPKDMPVPSTLDDLRQMALAKPLIRYSARSQFGSHIDRHLRRIGVAPPRRLEIDISDTVTAMVAAGIGWAITTPLNLLQGKNYPDQISVVALPGPRTTRTLASVSREGEYLELCESIAQKAREALIDECLPEVERRWPWLREQIVTC